MNFTNFELAPGWLAVAVLVAFVGWVIWSSNRKVAAEYRAWIEESEKDRKARKQIVFDDQVIEVQEERLDAHRRLYWDFDKPQKIQDLIATYIDKNNLYRIDVARQAKVSNTHVQNLLNSPEYMKSTNTGLLNQVLKVAGFKLVVVRRYEESWVPVKEG